MTEYFAACTLGLEGVLEDELRALGAEGLNGRPGGVTFEGSRELGYAAALWLRTAVRLQEVLSRGEVLVEQDLYEFARAIRWENFLDNDRTLAVDASLKSACLTHSQYAALRVKDAIVDRFRDRTGQRPSVDTKRPDLPLKLHLHGTRATLYRDLAGASLHKRGYRPVQVKSPLSEAIAAGLVLLSGWDRVGALCDPMCGSATIPIEAAWIAADRAPGLERRFAFERWPDFDETLWTSLREAALGRVNFDALPPIEAADQHPGAVSIAKDSIAAAGLRGKIRPVHASARDFTPNHPPAVVICNPPYGERLETDQLEDSWRELGDFLRRECAGATAFVLSGNPSTGRLLRLKADRKIPIHNGPIDCRLLRYAIGPRREQRAE